MLGCYLLNFGLSILIAISSVVGAVPVGLADICLKFGIYHLDFIIDAAT